MNMVLPNCADGMGQTVRLSLEFRSGFVVCKGAFSYEIGYAYFENLTADQKFA